MRTMVLLSETGKWIQIMKTGKFQHPGYGEMEITQDDLQKFKENFDNNVRGIKLFVDVNHDANHAAVGEFKALKVEQGKLFADVDWTAKGAELVKSGEYQYFSPEFAFTYTDAESGKKYKDVLLGGGITNRPFLKGMEPIELSEGDIATLLAEKDYDPDGDGDNDATTDPQENHDWMLDVLAGITPWPHDEDQQAKLRKVGATRQSCDAAYRIRQKQLKDGGKTTYAQATSGDGDKGTGDKPASMSEGGVTNSHKSPPKGYPTDKSQYADPDNYKYPIDKEHIEHDSVYYNRPGEREKGGYTTAQWESIGRKIVEAANRLIGPGYSYKDGKINTPSNKKLNDNPDDASQNPHQTDDVDAGQFNEPASHTHPNPGGGNMTTQPQNPQGSATQDGAGAITLAEYEALQKEVRVLKEANRRSQLSEKVNGFMFSESTKTGKILPAQRDKVIDLMMSMDDEQVTKFSEFIDELPDAIQFNSETGHGQSGKVTNRTELVEKRAAVLMSENQMSYRDAIIAADAEIPEV